MNAPNPRWAAAMGAAVLAAGLGMSAPMHAVAGGQTHLAYAGPAALASVSGGYYETDDSGYYRIWEHLARAESQGAAEFRVCWRISDTVSDAEVVVPASISRFVGYSKSFFDAGPKVQDVKFLNTAPLRFPEGSNASVDRITFSGGATVVVSEGASVVFSNCTFDNAPVVRGSAVFANCVFVTKTIENNGTATYTGTTEEPRNVGQPAAAHEPLVFSLAQGREFSATVAGEETLRSLPFELKGTLAGSANVAATIADAEGGSAEGLSVAMREGSVVVEGTPVRAGTYHVTIEASASKSDGSIDRATEMLTVEVQEKIEVKLVGTLQAFVVEGAAHGLETPVMTMATASGSSSGLSGTSLKIKVKEGEGDWASYNEFATSHDDVSISFSITPDGSGMKMSTVYDSAVISGTPANPGTYQVTATVTAGARVQASNPVSLRIYANDKNLQERIDALPEGTTSWDMEPYTIAETGNAVVPIALSDIYGSHESGVYGIIGKGENGNFATETLTIPAGADVTLHNMKVFSSVKIVVERGARLTFDDSVAYGLVEVNGGVLSAKNSSSFVNRIVLRDGSVLEDADIVSHAHFLTDGNYKVEPPLSPVLVEGTVTFKGDNSIRGEDSVACADGQTGMVVASGGVAVVAQGSSLLVEGGKVLMGSDDGGDAVLLQDGAIRGDGALTVVGGVSHAGEAGLGVAGTGTLDVATLVDSGGVSDGVVTPGEGEGPQPPEGPESGGEEGSGTQPGQVGDGQDGSGQEGSGQSGSGQEDSGQEGPGQVGPGQDGDGSAGSDQADSSQAGDGSAAEDPADEGRCDGGESCPSHGFADFDPDAWYHDALDWAIKNGVMRGMGDTGLIAPAQATTRAQAVTMLSRIAGAGPAYAGVAFSDVPADAWHAGAVAWGVDAGVVKGYGETGMFGPDDEVTREQMAVFLYRFAQASGVDVAKRADLSSFPDASEVNPWAVEAMSWAVAEGHVRGVSDERLAPQAGCERAQTAAMLMRFCEGNALTA